MMQNTKVWTEHVWTRDDDDGKKALLDALYILYQRRWETAIRGRCRDNRPTRCVYGYVEAVSLAVLAC